MVRTYKTRLKFYAINNETNECINVYKLTAFCTEYALDYPKVQRALQRKDSAVFGQFTIHRATKVTDVPA